MQGSRGPGGHRGSVAIDQAEPFAGDPRIAPGLPRPIGWRVRNLDGSEAYDKFGPLDTDWVPVGQASSSSVPISYTFDLPLSFGQGLGDTDDVLPTDDGDGVPFWFSPTLDSDHAEPGQVREWPGLDALDQLWLAVRIDQADLIDEGGRIIVTIDGSDLGPEVAVSAGATVGVTLSAQLAVAVTDTARIGARWAPTTGNLGGTLRCEIRVRGRWSGATPVPPVDFAGAANYTAKAGIGLGTGDDLVFWGDQDPLLQNLDQTIATQEPQYVADVGDGYPGVLFGVVASTDETTIYKATNLKKSSLLDFEAGDPRTIYCVFTPTDWTHGGSSGHGGAICCFRQAGGTPAGVFNCLAYNWNNDGLAHLFSNSVDADETAPTLTGFNLTRVIFKWVFDGTLCSVYQWSPTLGWVLRKTFTPDPTDQSNLPGFFLGGSSIGSGATGQCYMHEWKVFPSAVENGGDFDDAYTASLRAGWGVP